MIAAVRTFSTLRSIETVTFIPLHTALVTVTLSLSLRLGTSEPRERGPALRA